MCEKFTSWIDDSEVISKNTASWRPRLKGTILQCPTVVIIADANVVLNLLIHPFTCATVISILMSIIKTKVGIIALHTSFLWSTTEVSDNLQQIRNTGLFFNMLYVLYSKYLDDLVLNI